jgi:hypothetical protein
VCRLEEGQVAKEDLLGKYIGFKEEACWVTDSGNEGATPDSEDEGATPRLCPHEPEDAAEPRREVQIPATIKAPPHQSASPRAGSDITSPRESKFASTIDDETSAANGHPRAGSSADKHAAKRHASGNTVTRSNTVDAAEGRDVDGIASLGVTQYGKAQTTRTELRSDERAAARLPSDSGGLNGIGVTSDAGDATKRRSVDGIHRPRAPQLEGVRADESYDSLAVLK